MPRELKAWGCSFRCGHRVSTKRASIERHEKTCKLNPARRACATCRHEQVEYEDYNHRYEFGVSVCDSRRVNCCDVDARPEGVAMMVGCPKWEGRA